MADAFGLPASSQSGYYSVYGITPVQPTSVFVGPIAPTTQYGGILKTNGGATQYLVPNRSLFTEPKYLGGIYDR